LILLAGVYQLMISSKRTYNLQSDLARLQESARFALDFMSNDFRMAGYFGCSGTLTSIQSGPSLGNEIGFANNMFVLFGSENPAGSLNASDRIRVAYMDSNPNAFAVTHCARDLDNNGQPDNEGAGGGNCQPRTLAGLPNANFPTPTPLTANTTQFSSFGLIDNNERVLVEDCGGSDIYQVNAANTPAGDQTTITITPGLVKDYDNIRQSYGAALRRFVEARYFVAQNNRDGVSLFKQHYLGGAPRSVDDALPNTTGANLPPGVEEVVEGVENMQLRYNEEIDTNNDGTLDSFQYRTADNVTNWQNVRGVMITLLMRTVNQRFDMDMDTDTYLLDPGDDEYDPDDDYRARMIFGTTVMVRNN
jgi:type IV pilus assembly protein PilW